MEVKEIDRYLMSLLGSHQLVQNWWQSPNKAFEMRKPVDVWTEDQDGPKKIEDYVMFYCYAK